MRLGILMFGLVVLSSGCSVNGFRSVPDGLTTPSQLRSAAAVARAEADALDQIAEEREGAIQQIIHTAQGVADQIGAPALMTGLLGAAGGWLVPTPGQRRRERVAKAEGAVEKSGAA